MENDEFDRLAKENHERSLQRELSYVIVPNSLICWNKKLLSEDKSPKIKPKVPISKRSDKNIKLDEVYKIIRAAYLKNHPKCEANIKGICSINSQDIHHLLG